MILAILEYFNIFITPWRDRYFFTFAKGVMLNCGGLKLYADDLYVEVHADSERNAKELMRMQYGDKWYNCYEEKRFEDMLAVRKMRKYGKTIKQPRS